MYPTTLETFNSGVYADVIERHKLRGTRSTLNRFERKASEALPDWVYRYVSAASGDGRTQRANVDAFSHYGIVPRIRSSPPERDLSIDLFGERLPSQIFMSP